MQHDNTDQVQTRFSWATDSSGASGRSPLSTAEVASAGPAFRDRSSQQAWLFAQLVQRGWPVVNLFGIEAAFAQHTVNDARHRVEVINDQHRIDIVDQGHVRHDCGWAIYTVRLL